MPKKKKHHGVSYHGLHHPHVLRHVWRFHDWFENCVPRADDNDHDADDPAPDTSDTSSPADNPATI